MSIGLWMMLRNLSIFFFVAMVLSVAESAGGESIRRYTDRDGIIVITNVNPGKPKKRLKMKEKDGVMKVSAPAEMTRRSRDSREFDTYIDQACSTYRIPQALARAVMAAESDFDPNAVSSKGAQGLMQLMPRTAQEMYVSDILDPKQNIHGGIRYLRVLADMFEGDMIQTVAAYNAGPEAVRRAGGIPLISETQDYVRKVLRLYTRYKNEQ